MGSTINLTSGHIVRHAPGRAAQGLEGALLDVGQDLLLRDLAEAGVLDLLVFKGGTALRKLYAGNEGRFSVDLDFSVADLDTDAKSALDLFVEHVEGLEVGPFTYGTTERRGKRSLTVEAPTLGSVETLSSKLDINPPAWLEAQRRPWVPMRIHDQYGGPLPELPCVRLEETIAEKIARLNRVSTARDAYDLVWLKRTYRPAAGEGFDEALARRLAVLKIWVDANGMSHQSTAWPPGHEGPPFDPENWLRVRPESDFDEEDLGLLAVPTPKMGDLAEDLRTHYGFLARLDDDERRVAAADPTDRKRVMDMINEVSFGRVGSPDCW